MRVHFKFIVLTLLMFTGSLVVSAQTKDSMYPKISDYILRNYHPDSIALTKCCMSGCMFIKFRVNQRGDIADVSLSGIPDSAAFVKDALLFSVQMLRQDSRLIDFLKQSNKTIIQPFMFDYRSGCKIPESGTKNYTAYYMSYIGMFSGLAQTNYSSIFDMLKFDGKRLPFIDCIILEPIEVNNVVMH